MRYRFALGLAVLAIFFGSTTQSYAQPSTWQNTGTDWGTPANWSAGVPNNLATAIAIFGPSAVVNSPNVAATFSVNQITFDNSLAAYNLSGTGANQLRIGSGGISWTGGATTSISANLLIALDQTWNIGTTVVTVGGAGNLGSLNGTGALTVNGAGTLIVDSNAGLFTGGYVINSGTLQAGSATNNSGNQVLRSNSVNLGSTAILNPNGGAGFTNLRIGSLSGSGLVNVGSGNLNQTALQNSVFSGTVTGTNGYFLRGANGTTQSLTGNLTGLSGGVEVNSGATMALSGTGDSTSGVLGTTATFTSRGGTLLLDNSGGNTSAAGGRYGDAQVVTLGGGGLSLIGNSAGTTETVGALTMISGSSTISVTNNGTGAVLAFTDTGSLRDSTSGTYNFVGLGTGTLGAAGNNPRITFSGAINANTVNGALTSTASGPTTVTYGWARANTTGWAGNGANGIFALTEIARNSATLGAVAANEVTTFTPSTTTTTLAGNLGVATTPLLLKFTPSATGQDLAAAGFNINASGVMLAGTTDFAITGAGSLFGTVASTRYVYVTDPNTVLSTSLSFAGAQQPFGKSGPGTVFLNGGTNQLNFTSVQAINLLEGTFRGTLTSLGGGTSAGGAFTTLNLYGSVLEISGGGTFSRGLNVAGAAGGGGLKWDGGATARGDGGFSAIGGNAIVTLVTALGGATAATPVWNTGGFVADGYALTMGTAKADSRIDFTNNIGLDSGAATNNYFAREIRVAKNPTPGVTTDIARLSGVITGSSNADLLKTGAGTLELSNANTYAGNTLVNQGKLLANNVSGSATGTGNVIVKSGASIGGTGTFAPAAGNSVTIAGIVAPGNSVGTLNIAGNTNLSNGSLYSWEVNGYTPTTGAINSGASTSLANHDQLATTGTFTAGSFTFAVTELGAPTFTNGQTYSWTVATAIGTPTIGAVSFDLTNAPTFLAFGGAAQMSMTVAAGQMNFNFSPVPEPASVLGIAACGLGLAGWVRRRRLAAI